MIAAFYFPYLNKSHFQSLCKDFMSGVGSVLMHCPSLCHHHRPTLGWQTRDSLSPSLPLHDGNFTCACIYSSRLDSHKDVHPERMATIARTCIPVLYCVLIERSLFNEISLEIGFHRLIRQPASRVSVLVIILY